MEMVDKIQTKNPTFYTREWCFFVEDCLDFLPQTVDKGPSFVVNRVIKTA